MFRIKFTKTAFKEFTKLPKEYQLQIEEKITLISMWIYLNLDISRLSPQEEKRYRLRIWKYRVIYKKEDEILLITVIKIWSRWDVYK